MSASRRALLYHAKSSLRSNHRFSLSLNKYYVSCLSSISHKNQVQGTTTTPEDLSPLYKTVEGDTNAAGSRERSRPGMEKERRREDMSMDEAPRKTADSVAEMAKEGAVGAMETGLKLGKMAKQTMDGVLEVAENVRDSVDEDSDDSNRRRVQQGISDHRDENRSSDKFVEDLRRSAGGYDLKYRR